MNNASIYKSVIISKTGTEVPVFSDGKSVDSKYNPEREAENLISSTLFSLDNSEKSKKIITNASYFFIVIGIGSGTLIEKLSDNFPNSKIMAIETCFEDLQFLLKLEKIKKLETKENIIFTYINDIEKILINNYLPAIYKNFKIFEQKNWLEKNNTLIPLINKKINKAIGIISADFSVQTHFGKIWQSNIINNLKILSFAKNKVFQKADINKTAAIIAAGPSLDKSIKKLIDNRENYYIIATDTSLSVLIKNNIIPEIVVSIDGQHISHNHFCDSNFCSDTIFLLDLCSDYSVGKYLQSTNKNVSYFVSGHPLSSLANKISNENLPELFSGAGTVTITAFDLAFKLGFSHIEIFGADFAYVDGKAYAKGTYFDSLFGLNSSKTNTLETQYSKLMFRTELKKIKNNVYSTEILTAYKLSLEQYLADNNCILDNKDFIYKVKALKSKKNNFYLKSFPYDFNKFIQFIKNADLSDLKYPLLPYVAWLRNKKNDESLEFIALLKLAHDNIVRYN